MRHRGSMAVLAVCGCVLLSADDTPANLSGTWKLARVEGEPAQVTKDLMLVIEENGERIHVRETRGADRKDDVSDFTCEAGKECLMLDGGHKANVSVYYNGPILVILKTHGRRGDSLEKRRLSLSLAGDSLIVEVTHLEPQAKAEKLVFSKVH